MRKKSVYNKWQEKKRKNKKKIKQLMSVLNRRDRGVRAITEAVDRMKIACKHDTVRSIFILISHPRFLSYFYNFFLQTGILFS